MPIAYAFLIAVVTIQVLYQMYRWAHRRVQRRRRQEEIAQMLDRLVQERANHRDQSRQSIDIVPWSN